MIQKSGDLFTSDCPVIGQGVNTVGVMGAGIALAFKRRWPMMFAEYRRMCRMGDLVAGGCHIYATEEDHFQLIANMASQDKPGAHASLDWLDQSATCAALQTIERGYDTIAIPLIGCGIGGLRWEDAGEVLKRVESETGIVFEVWNWEGWR